MRKFDLIVVGAGISSGSLVYNLLKLGFKGSILVVDRGDKIASGPTAFSAGGFGISGLQILTKNCAHTQ